MTGEFETRQQRRAFERRVAKAARREAKLMERPKLMQAERPTFNRATRRFLKKLHTSEEQVLQLLQTEGFKLSHEQKNLLVKIFGVPDGKGGRA